MHNFRQRFVLIVEDTFQLGFEHRLRARQRRRSGNNHKLGRRDGFTMFTKHTYTPPLWSLTRTREFWRHVRFWSQTQVFTSWARKDKQPTVPYTTYLKNWYLAHSSQLEMLQSSTKACSMHPMMWMLHVIERDHILVSFRTNQSPIYFTPVPL